MYTKEITKLDYSQINVAHPIHSTFTDYCRPGPILYIGDTKMNTVHVKNKIQIPTYHLDVLQILL